MREDLRAAYLLKEKAELLLANLEKLKSKGSVTQTDYEALKAEYVKMLDEALPRIDSVKAELQKKSSVMAKDLEILKQELGIVQARLKVGEISRETYRQRGGPLEEKVRSLEAEISEFEAMIGSNSSADIGGPKHISRPKQRGTTSKPPPATKQPTKQKRKIAAYVISGLVVLAIVPIILMNTLSSPQYKIAFMSDRDGSDELYLVNADGSDLVRLSHTGVEGVF